MSVASFELVAVDLEQQFSFSEGKLCVCSVKIPIMVAENGLLKLLPFFCKEVPWVLKKMLLQGELLSGCVQRAKSHIRKRAAQHPC
jgi:hypothetical protein